MARFQVSFQRCDACFIEVRAATGDRYTLPKGWARLVVEGNGVAPSDFCQSCVYAIETFLFAKARVAIVTKSNSGHPQEQINLENKIADPT